jgi:pyruvate dehydrogenase E1 component alpha subunit
MDTVASFTIGLTRYLDPMGNPCGPLPSFAGEADEIRAMYRSMVLTRSFDVQAVSLQRTGRLGTYASSLGQEAVTTGLAAAMAEDDILLPSFREHGAQLWRGVTMEELFLYWGGDERGSNFSHQPLDFPVSVTVGGHAPHATGLAIALQIRGDNNAVLCVIGDGATSKGDVYEAMNFAGIRCAPLVFVINNNQWAISTPVQAQTAAQTLAQKAIAVGIPGEQVDGNDVFAVRERVGAALLRARSGEGPSVVEALTYRLADHTTADDASRYRDDAETSAQWEREPVLRLRRFMETRGLWDSGMEQALLEDCEERVSQAVAAYLETEPQAPESMFDYLYASLPDEMSDQREWLAKNAKGHTADG